MKDKLRNKIKKGDILLELDRGGGVRDTVGNKNPKDYKKFYSMKIWQMPKAYKNEGILYDANGNKHLFSYASLSKSIKIDRKYKILIFFFKNGLNSIDSYVQNDNLNDILIASDYKDKIIKMVTGQSF